MTGRYHLQSLCSRNGERAVQWHKVRARTRHGVSWLTPCDISATNAVLGVNMRNRGRKKVPLFHRGIQGSLRREVACAESCVWELTKVNPELRLPNSDDIIRS